jgi:hypothetical protein
MTIVSARHASYYRRANNPITDRIYARCCHREYRLGWDHGRRYCSRAQSHNALHARRQVADKVRCQMSPLVIRSPSRKVLLTGLRLQSRRRRKHCILAVHCWACNLGQQQLSKLPRVSRSREGTVVPLDLPQKRWLMLKSSGFFLVGNLVVVMGINEFVVSWSDLVLVRGQLHHQAEIQHFLADSGTVVQGQSNGGQGAREIE